LTSRRDASLPVTRPARHLSPNEPPSPDKPLSPSKQPSCSSFGAANRMMDQQRREVFKPQEHTRHKSDAPTAEQADTMAHFGPGLATKGDALPLHVSPTSIIDSRHAVLPKMDHCPPEGAISVGLFPSTGGWPQTEWAKVGNPLFVGCAVLTTHSLLEPYVSHKCDPSYPRLKPYVYQSATLCILGAAPSATSSWPRSRGGRSP
jgi:hypothetical protein